MMFAGVRKETGTVVFGVLFSTLGTKATLLCFTLVSLLVLVILLMYLAISHNYMKYTERTNETSYDSEEQVSY